MGGGVACGVGVVVVAAGGGVGVAGVDGDDGGGGDVVGVGEGSGVVVLGGLGVMVGWASVVGGDESTAAFLRGIVITPTAADTSVLKLERCLCTGQRSGISHRISCSYCNTSVMCSTQRVVQL